jgi:hypothetical protein
MISIQPIQSLWAGSIRGRVSASGQNRKSIWPIPTSGLPLKADIRRSGWRVRKVPILLQKSFWGVEGKILEPLMRFARGDVRDHIASSKIDHGPP